MTSSNDAGLSVAIVRAFELLGPQVFDSPQRLVGVVLDHSESESVEVRCFVRNCDEEYLQPFTELLGESQPSRSECVDDAVRTSADYLAQQWAIDRTHALSVAKHVAEGIVPQLSSIPSSSSGMQVAPSPIPSAVVEVLSQEGLGILHDADSFRRLLMERLSMDDIETRLLSRNCDDEFLAPFAKLCPDDDPRADALRQAGYRAAKILMSDRMILEKVAQSTSDQVVQGIASYLCINLAGSDGTDSPLDVTYNTPLPDQRSLEGFLDVTESDVRDGLVNLAVTNTSDSMAQLRRIVLTGRKTDGSNIVWRVARRLSIAPGMTQHIVIDDGWRPWSTTQRSYSITGNLA